MQASLRCPFASGPRGASQSPQKKAIRSAKKCSSRTAICCWAAKLGVPAAEDAQNAFVKRLRYKWRMMMPHASPVAEGQLQLVAQLASRGIIQSQRTIDVMSRVDRGCFVHNLERPVCTTQQQVYQDDPLPIGLDQTISAPSMHGICLDLLTRYLTPGASALDVGSGSGYLTACMALLVGPSGSVVGVEKHAVLTQQSIKNIQAACPELEINTPGSVIQLTNDNIYRGDLLWPGQQFDAIHVGAAAVEVPQLLVERLKPGGRMVLPVGRSGQTQVLAVVDKSARGLVTRQDIIPVRYVPLTQPEDD